MKSILVCLLTFIVLLETESCFSYGGGAVPTQVEMQVHKILESFLQSDSYHRFKSKHYPEASGVLEVDLVVKGKKIETFYVDSSTVVPSSFVNAFENYIKDMQFDFKLAKGERQKIHHQFVIQGK